VEVLADMTPASDHSRGAFEEAATWFVSMTASVRDRWDAPGLGEWTVRDLVGHASRSFLTIEAYLLETRPEIEIDSASRYYEVAMASAGDPAAVAERGRAAGAALGREPALEVTRLARRVLALVATTSDDARLETAAGVMRLADYLPTRTFELCVHTCDLAEALSLDTSVPVGAAEECGSLLGAMAARQGRAADLLLASTGRRGLPTGFSVLS